MKMRKFASIALAVPLFISCFTMKPEAVDEASFLGSTAWENEGNPISYRSESGDEREIPLFFSAERKDLSFILLMDLKGNDYYKTIEYQAVSDNRGNGHIVILYDREDGKNIYYSPDLKVSPGDYSDFDDVRSLTPAHIQGNYRFGKNGLSASLKMEDREGRLIRYIVNENREPGEPGGLIAPVTGDVENPDSLPLVYMDGFGFSPVEGTSYQVFIDDEEQEIQSIPFKLNGYRPLMIRYSRSSPVINWNREYAGELALRTVHRDYKSLSFQGWDINLFRRDGVPEIESMISKGQAGDLTLRFSPPLPNLVYLDRPDKIEGRFSFSSRSHRGIFAGEYTLEKEGSGEWSFSLDPTHSSKPPVIPGSWWRKFHYRAIISLMTNEIRSEWIRE